MDWWLYCLFCSQTSTTILLPNQVPEKHSTSVFMENIPSTSSATPVWRFLYVMCLREEVWDNVHIWWQHHLPFLAFPLLDKVWVSRSSAVANRHWMHNFRVWFALSLHIAVYHFKDFTAWMSQVVGFGDDSSMWSVFNNCVICKWQAFFQWSNNTVSPCGCLLILLWNTHTPLLFHLNFFISCAFLLHFNIWIL